MTYADDYWEPTHLHAIRDAWHEFKEGVSFKAFCLSDDCALGGPKLPVPIAWLCAPWGPLAYRFRRHNLERLFRPKKAERRQRLDDLCQCAVICGGAQLSEESWAEVPALLAEFGGDFPPRDYEPMTVCQMVGGMMGMAPEVIAEIEARPLPR